jgi:outer membrane protein assembly factor BamD
MMLSSPGIFSIASGRRSLAGIATLLAAVVALLAACSSDDNKYDETRDWSAEKLYSRGKEELLGGDYKKAINYYEKLEARYPYGKLAQQAQLEIGYAYYKDKDVVAALAAADRFIKLHPNHPNVDYAYYLKGLVNFNEDLGLMGNISGQDLSERDPKAARESFEAFKELITRFPDSRYAADSVARMRYLVNAMARNEVGVAEYYLRRQAYIAAVNRSQFVIANYQQSPAVEQALIILVKAYDALGLNELRDDSARLLKLNFPNSQFSLAALHKKAWWQLW